MSKKLFTRRYEEVLLEKVKEVAAEEDITHTKFIEDAMDEKLLRDGHIDDSLIHNEIDQA